MSFREIADGFELGARNAIGVALACASAGIIIGAITLTGLGLKLGNGLVELAGGNLMVTLFFTMITSLILGMGVPTTPTYIIMATLTAPALIAVGRANGLEIPLIAVHLFVFYFGILADDTPPVGLAAYAAAGIARSDPIRAGWRAFSLDMRTFLLPFMFITAPAMLLIDTTVWEASSIFVTASIGMYGLAAAMQGYLITEARWWERVVLFVGAIALGIPKPDGWTDRLRYRKSGKVITENWEDFTQSPSIDQNRIEVGKGLGKDTGKGKGKKPPKDGAEKAPRPRDLLFDAIAKVTCTDPTTAGPSIGKVEQVFKKAEPPYTPEEVLKFAELWPAWKDKPPTLWQLKEQIGIVRTSKNGQASNNATHQRRIEEPYTAEDLAQAERINARRAAKAAGML